MGNFTVFIIAVCVLFSECLIEVKKTTEQSCSTSDPKKDCDQSKYMKLKTLQSRRLLQRLIKQREIMLSCDISTGQYQSSSGTKLQKYIRSKIVTGNLFLFMMAQELSLYESH